jgi:uncharacterized protein YfiM (DUF2279 family)
MLASLFFANVSAVHISGSGDIRAGSLNLSAHKYFYDKRKEIFRRAMRWDIPGQTEGYAVTKTTF